MLVQEILCSVALSFLWRPGFIASLPYLQSHGGLTALDLHQGHAGIRDEDEFGRQVLLPFSAPESERAAFT
jgi:hypothetical protein